ncbi:MAG: inverse autotransporter beta domain-containing protein [Sneathiella sp.]|nr:inverse autotransporter beta domain-containing protein [Sneathiella sp.]
MKKTTSISLAAYAALLLGTTSAMAADKWDGYFELEGRFSNERSIGEGGIFVPLLQSDDSLLFTDIRGKFDNQDSSEFNLGLGYRQIIDQNWILGGYAFYDRRRSPLGNDYNQATVGVEAYTESLSFRVNGYIPENTENSSGVGGKVGLISGGQFLINEISGGSERALPGFDAEVGYKFYLSDNWNLTTTAGGFYFDADGYEEVSGPRGRVELSYDDIPFLAKGSRFTLGLETQHDNVRGEQTFGLARITIPFSQFSTDGMRKSVELSRLEKRMTDRIVRDVDIVAGEVGGEIVSSEAALYTLPDGTTSSEVTVLDATDNVAAEIITSTGNSLIVIDGSQGTISMAGSPPVKANQMIVGGGKQISLTGQTSGNNITFTLPGSRPNIAMGGSRFDLINDNATIDNLNIISGTGTTFFINADNIKVSNIDAQNIGQFSAANTSAGTVLIEDITATNLSNFGMTLNGGNWTVRRATFDNVSNSVTEMRNANISFDTVTIRNAQGSGITAVDSNGAVNLTINNTTIENTASNAIVLLGTGGAGATATGSNNVISGTLGNNVCESFGAAASYNNLGFSDVQGGGPQTCN